MNLKNLVSSGDYVVPVPFGGHITLQYDESGNIQKAFKGWGTTEDITTEISLFDVSRDMFPSKISVRALNGTIWVYGVLYTASNILSEFDSVNDAMIDMYIQHPNQFEFYACCCKGTAMSFSGSAGMLTWFRSNKFNVLNGFLVNANYNESVLQHFFDTQFTFKCPQFASYLLINGEDFKFIETQVHAHIVTSIKNEMAENGQIISKLKCKDGKELSVDYSVLVKYNIHKNSCILLDENGSIQYSYFTDNKSHAKLSSEINCSICGKPIKVEEDKPTICTNPHCLSTMYPIFRHFCKGLDIPVLTYTDYKKDVNDKKIFCLSDIMTLDEYKDLEIHTTLAKLLDAIIPVADVRFRNILNLFANNCSNNIDTFSYYIEHSNEIADGLQLRDYQGCDQLVNWLSDIENQQTVLTLSHDENFIYDVKDRKFNGDPIFRGKVIYITGTFQHGNTSDIIQIFQSYSAEVTTKFNDKVTEVVVGDIPEDVSGVSIRKAKKDHIPVLQECDFFKMYDIDEDLKKNL